MSLSAVFYVLALVVFVLATFSVALGTVPLIPLGLAFVAAGLLVGGVRIGDGMRLG